MTWADFYLICFAVGFAFSLLSFLGGGLHWHLHFPGLHGAGAHLPATHAGTAGHVPTAESCKAASRGNSVSPFNLISLAAFLAWFGGTGYLLTRFSSLWFVVGLGLAAVSGLAGALIIFLFLSRVLTSEEENLDPADFEMSGVLGRVSIPIRADGTGELIYSQAGTRRTCGARSEDGKAIPKGSEVVVTRYEKGIAFVRLWTEMSGEESSAEATAATTEDMPQQGSGQ
jgi:hypothetical protein